VENGITPYVTKQNIAAQYERNNNQTGKPRSYVVGRTQNGDAGYRRFA